MDPLDGKATEDALKEVFALSPEARDRMKKIIH
jgi:hypothetical protein